MISRRSYLSTSRCATFCLSLILAPLPVWAAISPDLPPETEQISVDAHAAATPFPHFWEEMFGSGRAALSLRESYRDDLRAVKAATDFRYVRFHGILHDELGVYNEDEHGNPVYNFTYIDQIYDGLLKNGVRPVVEISFMPKKLAFNPDDLHAFWYKPNVSPPKSMERWDDLIEHLVQHLADRYGVDEVSQWYFEVWNEPNIDFWGGIPRKESYFDLYAHTARTIKKVSPRFRVGGPATAATAWIPDFLAYTAQNHVPLDFVSTHGYADEPVERLLGTHEEIPMEERVCRTVAKVRGQIDASATPHLPLLWTEWNVRGDHELRDTTYVGPALAETVRGCDGTVQALSFWTFSDVFEEGGPSPKPFEGQFGLRATFGINKPSFYAFSLLHQLGSERIADPAHDAIVTRLADGSLAIAVWNLIPPEEHPHGKTVTLHLQGVSPQAEVSILRVDDTHGNVLPFYRKMGSPIGPTEAQVNQLNRDTALGPPEKQALRHGTITLELGANALLLLRISASPIH